MRKNTLQIVLCVRRIKLCGSAIFVPFTPAGNLLVPTVAQPGSGRLGDSEKHCLTATMAASAKTLILEKPNSREDWTVVLPRRGKYGRNLTKIKPSLQQQQEQQEQQTHWAPIDLETNPERESRLVHKMQTSIEKLEKTQFFDTLLDQIQSPELSESFLKVLGSEPKMQMVIYGIGSIESFEPPRFQLALAILIKRKLDWIGEIEVFDPVISLTESVVMEGLGCSVLSVNEGGRRRALKPTLFFMPHCEVELYDNLLHANWSPDLLNRVVLFGNSFESYAQQGSLFKHSRFLDSRKHLSASRSFTKEFEIKTVTDDYFRAFQGLAPNQEKSQIFCSDAARDTRRYIRKLTGFQEGSFPIKYLGVPMLSMRIRAKDCDALVKKLTERASCWTANCLSQTGRVQLIKSILIAMQQYWYL